MLFKISGEPSAGLQPEYLDLALLRLTDDPDEVCDIVTSGHAAQVAALEARS